MRELIIATLIVVTMAMVMPNDNAFVNAVENGTAFVDVWHENVLPFEIRRINAHTKVLSVELDRALTSGSDGACQAAGQVILHMLEQMPEGWAIYVTNEWVPSAKNPIDLGWARVLADDGY